MKRLLIAASLPVLRTAFAAVAIIITSPASAEQTNSAAVADDAGFLIGRTLSAIAFFQRCERELPEQADLLNRKIAETRKANEQLLLMARRKLLAIVDLEQGKQFRDKVETYYDNFPALAQAEADRTIAAASNPKQFCNNAAMLPGLILSEKYPDKVSSIVQFPVGYKWSPPGCEYTLLFPVQPEINFITVDGTSTIRAMTPERESVPGSLGASCWESSFPQIQAAGILKARGEKLLSEYGVTEVQWSETLTSIGYKLVASGIRHVSGISFAYREVLLIGEHSVVDILGVELSAEYPSAQLIEFENTIAKR